MNSRLNISSRKASHLLPTPSRAIVCASSTPSSSYKSPVNTRRAVLLSTVAVAASASNFNAYASDIIDVQAVKDTRFANAFVLVAGATGGVGKEVVKILLDKGVKVRALVRDVDRARSTLPSSSPLLEIVKGDVTQFATLPSAFQGITHVVCATGVRPALDPTGPFNVDFNGTVNLVAAAKQTGSVQHFSYVTSIGTDDILFPLNLAWGVLFWKKRGEEDLQRSGLKYTIVRPGGLVTEVTEGRGVGPIVMEGPDSFGLPPRKQPGSILRSKVAEILVESLVAPEADGKVVEVIQKTDAPQKTLSELFQGVRL